MPLPHPDAFNRLKNALFSGDEWIWLFEVRSPTGGPIVGAGGAPVVVRVTPHTSPVTWGALATGEPMVWTPWPVGFAELPQDSKSTINEIRLTFSNVLSAANRLLADNAFLRSHRVHVHLVHAAQLDSAVSAFSLRATVVDVTASWESVTLTLSAFAFLDFTVPKPILSKLCRRQYRGLGCDFLGDPDNTLGDCVKTSEACELRGAWELANGLPKDHPRKFGGFPSILTGPLAAKIP